MDFPDLALVQLAARDLTGPGIEFYARRVSGSTAVSTSLGVSIPADQLSPERLYMLRWASQSIPSNAIALRTKWYLQLPTIDILLWASPSLGFAGSVGVEVCDTTPAIVIPGGKPLLFVAEWSGLPATLHALDGWITGYSFPKGNVLSF